MNDLTSPKYRVYQSNILVESSYKLIVDEKRLLLAGISQINSEQEVPDKVSITVDLYARLFGISIDSAYSQVKNARRSLFERKITFRNNDVEDDIRWVRRATYHKGEGRVDLYFSNEIKPLLGQLKNKFTPYYLEAIDELHSFNAIRMYELLAQFKDLKHRWMLLDLSLIHI